MKKQIKVIESLNFIDHEVEINGWVHTIRDMGQIAFIELRDNTGLIQVVIDDHESVPKLGVEYVIKVCGKVRKRGERYINKRLETGTIELGAETIDVINESADLPFEVKKDTSDINEELRLKHRYLDLRSQRMTANLKLRHNVLQFVRNFLDAEGFIEVDTPMLTKGTPEGAREFLVPSRLHPEEFYVLPQSPQQFKQLLMVGGVGSYFQIAKCLRDEDQRGDRQPEFTQIDMEMSFVDQEDILKINEKMMVELIKKVAPEKTINQPFTRLTYADAMEKYGTDKPDLRKNKEDDNELALLWVTDFPMFENNKQTGKLDAMHHPFAAPKKADLNKLDSEPLDVRADAYDLVLNGYEIAGGSVRINDSKLQSKIFSLLGLEAEETERRFGHILEAFKYGTPPHGGIAYGLDRLLMILAGEPNIREVMAFPKTGDARDPLTGAPSKIEPDNLAEAHIKTIKPKS